MKSYLVGGAVRDELLALPVTDRDWVVVGSTPDELINAGYQSVGRDFPVFLHPKTHEEYALARMERKTGPGYHGFDFITDPTVTLEEDLSRRDLTINAMARSPEGELIDPYHGKADLDARKLRHVSDAFVEDPVRVLRVARFMARFAPLGFDVAAETQTLMRTMVEQGEVNNLVAERVWQEMVGALSAQQPRAFFDTLRQCHALSVILPELDALFGVPQSARSHPEIDCGLHTLMVLDQCSLISQEPETRFAALCHDLGKATTPANELPSHPGHEERGAQLTDALCQRLRVPRKARDLAVLSARYHTHAHRACELDATQTCELLQALDVIRKPDRFLQFLQVCEADSRGRLGFEDKPYPQAQHLIAAAEIFKQVDSAAVARSEPDKSRIAEAITQARTAALAHGLKAG